MLTIRLQRTGRKHEPTFRVVLTESKNGPKSGKFLEVLGSYDPRQSNESLKEDRIRYWISQGAQTSDTVHNLLINQKVIDGKKINVLPKKTPPPVKEEEVKSEAPTEVAETIDEKTEASEAPKEVPAEESKEDSKPEAGTVEKVSETAKVEENVDEPKADQNDSPDEEAKSESETAGESDSVKE